MSHEVEPLGTGMKIFKVLWKKKKVDSNFLPRPFLNNGKCDLSLL